MNFSACIPFNPTNIKHEFQRIGGNPLKKLGQNFFSNFEVLDKVVLSLPVNDPLFCLEIGPGFGALTVILFNKWRKSLKEIVLVEKDSLLADFIKNKIKEKNNINEVKKFNRKIKIFNDDILKPSREFSQTMELWRKQVINISKKIDLSGKCVCAGSLPYYISTPILEWFINQSFFGWGLFLLQKEIVEKFLEKPKTRFAHWLNLHGEINLIRTIKPGCFYPSPKVDSMAFYFKRDYSKIQKFLAGKSKNKSKKIISRKLEIQLLENAERILKMIFWGKRKMIITSLLKNPHYQIEPELVRCLLTKAQISSKLRPEALSSHDILNLAYYLGEFKS